MSLPEFETLAPSNRTNLGPLWAEERHDVRWRTLGDVLFQSVQLVGTFQARGYHRSKTKPLIIGV